MNRRVFVALLALLLVTAPALHSLPGVPLVYQVEDLGKTADGLVPTVTGINASGQVSGYVSGAAGLRAVRFTDGVGWAYLPGLQSVFSVATAINASGDLTGYYMPAGLRAFRYGDTIGLTTIAVLSGGTYGLGQAIAANGEVVGYGNSSTGQRAWRTGSGLGVLPIVPTALSGSTSSACGVNAVGQMVGTFTTSAGFDHAFRLEPNGSLTHIGTLGGPTSSACGLDADGRVGGESKIGTATHAFVFSGTALTDVDSFQSTFSTLAAMANGVGVGMFNWSASQKHAFVYTNAGGATDLNTTIPAGSGWILSDATAVSSTGQIVGHGLLGGSPRVYRLTPGAPPDTTAPVVTSVTASPSTIWPPKGQTVTVTTSAVATDNSGDTPACTLESITIGGAAAPDASVTGANTGTVKAVGGRTYTFNETCVDGSGNGAWSSVNVTVPPDVTAPVIVALTAAPSIIWPPNRAMVPVTLSVNATDDVDDAPACALSAISSTGTTADDYSITGQFSARVRAVGGRTYSLRVACADAVGNRRDASVDVVVPPDTTAPVISALSASPDHIWPPNNKMESVTVTVTATDDVDATPACALTSISGAPTGYAVVTGPFTASLRSEKDVVYTLNVGCADRAGNKSHRSVRVAVSKDSPSATASSKK